MRFALATCALFAAFAGCCNSVASPGSCVPGQEIACACPSGGQGVQVCEAAGDAYGPCACGGSGGGATGCTPGAQVACYDGPTGTEGVGVCKAGQRTCLPDGSGYGPCAGQVLPSPDLCSTAADEDCDGSPTPCVQDASWCHTFNSQPQGMYPLGLGVDAAKNVYFAFMAGGDDLGDGPLQGPSVVKYDPAGNVLWSKAFPYWPPTAFTVAADGSVLFGGTFSGAEDFGAGVLACPGSTQCPYLVKLAPDGAVVFTKAYFPQNEVPGGTPYAIRVDGAGNVVIGGHLQGTFACGASTIQAGGSDAFVAKLSPAGDCLWARKGGVQANGLVYGLDVDTSGNVLVSGWFTGSMSLGGVALTAPLGVSLFVTKLDPSGNAVFSRALGGGTSFLSVAVTPNDDVLVAGTFTGTLDLGAGPMTATADGAVFVAKLDPGGQHLWSNGYGSGNLEVATAVRPTPSGGAVVTGYFKDLVDFGAGSMKSAGGIDVFLAQYDAAGAGLSTHHYGDVLDDYGVQLAVNATGTPIIAGAFMGTLDTGSGPITGPNGLGVFVCQIAE